MKKIALVVLLLVVPSVLSVGCTVVRESAGTVPPAETVPSAGTVPPAESANAVTIAQIYAFGDSYTDDGASFEISAQLVNDEVQDAFILPGDLYWENRWTNGPTAPEVLAERLQAELTNYGVGGAKSGPGNYYSWIDPFQETGVLGQVDQFEAELSGDAADPDALYFIFISANDYFEHVDFGLEGTLVELADESVENMKTAVSRLSELGAEQFMVVNSTDLAMLPAVIAPGQVDLAMEFQTRVNEQLPTELEALASELDVEIVLFDHVAVSDEILSDPAQYGLTNVTDACQPVYPEVMSACDSPDEHYFWDEWHPTRRVHEIVGEAMVDALNE